MEINTNSLIGSTDIMADVRDKIKSTILESIPEEKWQGLIDVELKNFFENRNGSTYSGNSYESPFRKMVREEMYKFVTGIIKDELNKDDWKHNWDGIIGDKLKDTLVKAAPEMIAQWFSQLASQQIMVWASTR